jgi:uncharacterized protein with PIN domain
MAEIKFVADVMVGKLARWLRVLGFDVVYSNVLDDDEIVRLAKSENRIILTRDNRLAARCRDSQYLFVESDAYKEQLQQVLRAFGLKDFNVFSRCLECNTPLQEVDKETVFERIPPFIYLTQDRFATCPTCNRVYWHGTHADEMLKRIQFETRPSN